MQHNNAAVIIQGGTVHINTINSNIFNNTDPTHQPEGLDAVRREGDGFRKGPGAQVEDDPKDLGDIGGDTACGNVCKASDAVSAAWVHRPSFRVDFGQIWFNDASITAYGLRSGMQILPTLSADRKIIRFFLGTENFPNRNARNKTGHFNLDIEEDDRFYTMEHRENKNKKHVIVFDEKGEPYPNREWLRGVIGPGKKSKFSLSNKMPTLVGNVFPLYLDRRYHYTAKLPNRQRLRRYYVLYGRVVEGLPVTHDAEKFCFDLRDSLARIQRERLLQTRRDMAAGIDPLELCMS